MYGLFLDAEGDQGIYMLILCSRRSPDKEVQFNWGERRPAIGLDAYEVKGHSSSHLVRVRYGSGATQSENWQLLASTARNISLPDAYIGDGAGRIYQYQQVDTLTVQTDTDKDPIQAEFDLRGLDAALSRLNQHCQ